MNHLKIIEQEKADMIASQVKKQETRDRDKENEIDRLREQHRYE